MPRKPNPPRLHLRSRPGRGRYYVILDRGHEYGTGCSEDQREQAERELARYITEKYQPPKTGGSLTATLIADVMTLYQNEQAPQTADKGAWIGYMATPILDWWGTKVLADINKSTCLQYVTWRTGQGVSDQTARHELKTLRAAIKHYHASSYGPLTAVPVITLPAKKDPRQDYWLTRKQVADRIRAARRLKQCKHVVRMMLIGVYTGTRPGACLHLRWLSSTDGGWFDLDSETLHRRGTGARRSKKLQPPVRIHSRLLPFLRRWKKADLADKITNVIHYYGKPVQKLRRSWVRVAIEAGHAVQKGVDKYGYPICDIPDGPHICRHTAATWLMQSGVDQYEAAGYLGMSPETLWNVYGHHSPHFQERASKASGRRHVQEMSRKTVNTD